MQKIDWRLAIGFEESEVTRCSCGYPVHYSESQKINKPVDVAKGSETLFMELEQCPGCGRKLTRSKYDEFFNAKSN